MAIVPITVSTVAFYGMALVLVVLGYPLFWSIVGSWLFAMTSLVTLFALIGSCPAKR